MPSSRRKSLRHFEAPNLLQIAMPMGGIGAGCVSLNGYGGLQDFAIRHRPANSAIWDSGLDAAFGLLRINGGKPVTRLLEGPLPVEKIYNQGIKVRGDGEGGYSGMPRFSRCSFDAEYPFGHVNLSDPKVPLKVRITGYNPFIPLDDVASGLPGAILEYTFQNPTRKSVDFEFSYHLSHLAEKNLKEGQRGSRTAAIPQRGVFYSNTENPLSENFGTACLMVLEGKPLVKGSWFRGAWFDAMSALWREVSTGKFTTNSGYNGIDHDGRNGGSVLLRGSLKPGAEITFPLAITWHFPNVNFTVGGDPKISEARAVKEKAGELLPPLWQPFYAGLWKDARDVADFIRENYTSLRRRSKNFADALNASTLPPEVMDAVSCNLAILKSPTVLRQKNGNLWGWEGCNPDSGSCPGSCTHVWNYAQAFAHLFPPLERTLREQEFLRSLGEDGFGYFRSALPDGTPDVNHGFWKSKDHAASDGQPGGILKLHREWQISGDTDWLRSLYSVARLSMEYCIETWDPQRKGVFTEPHHNTYDVEFWGADGMCSSIYIGALCAMSEIATALHKVKDAATYRELAAKGSRYLEKNLYNGEYFFQKVQYEGLRDQSFVEKIRSSTVRQSEVLKLLKREGPKYQYGIGCLSDGIIGAWMAELYGVKTPLSREKIRSTLKAIHHYNFRRDLREHSCPQRPNFAIGHESGLLLCTWPKGGKPTLPFPYSDEVWTGIEYQVASHLILEGLVEEGIEIVRGLRSRYDGRVRNPFNEYECGSFYARAMASYALLSSFSGFRYSAVEQTLWFAPKLEKRPFKCFFSAASGFGVITLEKKSLTVEVVEGTLKAQRVVLALGKKTLDLSVRTVAQPGKPVKISL